MTILEASGHLYEWFSENDAFSMENDFMKIITITEEPDRDRVAFACALKQFEEIGLVSNDFSSNDHRQYWVLNKSFLSFEQSVKVSPELALTISNIINKFCEVTDNEFDLCDPAKIEEKDLNNLIYITNVLVSSKDKEDLG